MPIDLSKIHPAKVAALRKAFQYLTEAEEILDRIDITECVNAWSKTLDAYRELARVIGEEAH